jgi:hypothetical protein
LKKFKHFLSIKKLNYSEEIVTRLLEEIAAKSNRKSGFYSMPPFLLLIHLEAEEMDWMLTFCRLTRHREAKSASLNGF